MTGVPFQRPRPAALEAIGAYYARSEELGWYTRGPCVAELGRSRRGAGRARRLRRARQLRDHRADARAARARGARGRGRHPELHVCGGRGGGAVERLSPALVDVEADGWHLDPARARGRPGERAGGGGDRRREARDATRCRDQLAAWETADRGRRRPADPRRRGGPRRGRARGRGHRLLVRGDADRRGSARAGCSSPATARSPASCGGSRTTGSATGSSATRSASTPSSPSSAPRPHWRRWTASRPSSPPAASAGRRCGAVVGLDVAFQRGAAERSSWTASHVLLPTAGDARRHSQRPPRSTVEVRTLAIRRFTVSRRGCPVASRCR